MRCVSCLQGFMWECRKQGNCDDGYNPDAGSGNAIGSLLGGSNGDSQETSANLDRAAEEELHRGSGESSNDPDPEAFITYKDDSALRDQQSTGRKRAAKLYPLNAEAPCEWKMRKNCGGGQFPIVGCLDGIQQARHHGPDKNTLNNEKGNVHRICHTCHNRWHTLNDPAYVIERDSMIYHEPYEATIADVGMNEVFWEGRKLVKARD